MLIVYSDYDSGEKFGGKKWYLYVHAFRLMISMDKERMSGASFLDHQHFGGNCYCLARQEPATKRGLYVKIKIYKINKLGDLINQPNSYIRYLRFRTIEPNCLETKENCDSNATFPQKYVGFNPANNTYVQLMSQACRVSTNQKFPNPLFSTPKTFGRVKFCL